MISIQFVKLAREVIRFIKNGNKLVFSHFVYNNSSKTCCPLGAVAFNHNQTSYNFVESALNFENGKGCAFYCGFDDFFIFDHPEFSDMSEYYEMGFKFAQMCKKRGWILE